jgi:hypothetical protein
MGRMEGAVMSKRKQTVWKCGWMEDGRRVGVSLVISRQNPLLTSLELLELSRNSRRGPIRRDFGIFSRRHGRHQLFHAKDVERPAQIVGERRQAELGAHLFEASR